jgi:hypothetical protein
MTLALTVAVALCVPAAEPRQGKTTELTLTGGKRDLSNAAVSVLVPAGAVPGKAGVELRDEAGKTYPCQLTGPGLLAGGADTKGKSASRELHFFGPALKAGATLKLQLRPAETAGRAGGFSWQPGAEVTELRLGDRPVLRYMHAPLDDSTKERRELTYKVYHHLFDPTGSRLVTKGPGGLYTHHRGLFYGFNRITYGDGKKADTWHCTGDTHLAHEQIAAQEAGPLLGRHRVLIGWRGVGKERFAAEERELTVFDVPGGILVEFTSVLKTTGGPVLLDGDPQHAGFQFRADNEVAAQTAKQTIYIRPDGVGKPGETRNWPQDKGHVNLPWNAMSFVLGGKRYTAAYLDHPANPKEARYSERDYGRFGSYFEYRLTPEKPLAIRYRLWLQEGQMTPEQVAALSAAFTDPPRVTVK